MPTLIGASASPFVRKVRVFLAEKGIAYDHEQLIPFNVPPEYKKISPLGKIPAFRDGERTLCDSSVICAYLERTHPNPPLYPRDAYDYARALWFEEYSDSALAGVVGAKIFFPKIIAPRFFNRPADDAAIAKAFADDVPPVFDYLESQLGDAPAFVGGTFSIADIAIASQLVNLRHAGFGVDAARWPKLARHTAAAFERPSLRPLIAEETAAFGGAA
jgi:glutathione S-transferase